MKAIILAAGEGTRLRPLTNDRPKCMVEYHGMSILDHQLTAMKACGLSEVVIVKGYKAEAFERPGTLTVVNERFRETNMVHSLFCAENHFTDDILVSYGDIVYGPAILGSVVSSPHDFALAISMNWRELWQQRMEDPLSDAETLRIGSRGKILELGKKPRSYEDIQGQYMGLFKIKKDTLDRVRSFYHSLDRSASYDGLSFDRMYMTSFIQNLIDAGIAAHAVEIREPWLEIDTLSDLHVECGI